MAAFNLSLPKLQIALNRAWVDSMYNTQFIANVAAGTGGQSQFHTAIAYGGG